jgi:hypothetical protein
LIIIRNKGQDTPLRFSSYEGAGKSLFYTKAMEDEQTIFNIGFTRLSSFLHNPVIPAKAGMTGKDRNDRNKHFYQTRKSYNNQSSKI